MAHQIKRHVTAHRRNPRSNHLGITLMVGFLLWLVPVVTAHARSLSPLGQQRSVPSGAAQGGDLDTRTLEPGKPIEREMAGGEVHNYRVIITAGQYLYVVVDQRGIDVVVSLFGPDGKKLIEVDSPNGTLGPEPVSWVAEVTGSYKLEVRSPEKGVAPGRYEAKIEELREATARDRNRIAAQRTYFEGEQLREQGTAASRRQAIAKYQESLPLWRAAGDRQGESVALHAIGYVYDLLSEEQKSLEYYEQALQLRRDLGDRQGEAKTLSSMGAVYDSLGEKQKAHDYYSRSLALRRAVKDRLGEAYTLNNLGSVLNDLGEKQKALDHLDQALIIFREMGERQGRTFTLNDLGLVYFSLGEKQKAFAYFEQALELSRMVRDRQQEATLLNNIGFFYGSIGDTRKALEYYDKTLQLRRAVGDRRGEGQTLSNIGTVYASLREPQKALGYYDQALPIFRSVKDPGSEASTLHGIARAERARNRLAEALTQTEAALKIIESQRSKIASPDWRASYLSSVSRLYELYINVLMELHRLHPEGGYSATAFEASERYRARSLLELLAEARADIRQGVDPHLLERERALQRRLDDKVEYRMRLLGGRHTEEQAGNNPEADEGYLSKLKVRRG